MTSGCICSAGSPVGLRACIGFHVKHCTGLPGVSSRWCFLYVKAVDRAMRVSMLFCRLLGDAGSHFSNAGCQITLAPAALMHAPTRMEERWPVATS